MVKIGLGAMATGLLTIGIFFFLFSLTEGSGSAGIAEIIIGTNVICPEDVKITTLFNPLITDEFSIKSGFWTVKIEGAMVEGSTIIASPRLSGTKQLSWFLPA
jgi:acetyltransferase-like isoleucine patch superfamily enzyme